MADLNAIYSYYRDEIKREDEINHNRMVTSLTFQGFLLGAVGFLLSGAWPADPLFQGVVLFRERVLMMLGLIELIVSAASFIGIQATRMSIGDTKYMFSLLKDGIDGRNGMKKLEIDPRLPKIHGRGVAFLLGNIYSRSMPAWFWALWTFYLIEYFEYMAPDYYYIALYGSISFFIILTGIIISLNLYSDKQRNHAVKNLYEKIDAYTRANGS